MQMGPRIPPPKYKTKGVNAAAATFGRDVVSVFKSILSRASIGVFKTVARMARIKETEATLSATLALDRRLSGTAKLIDYP